MRLSKRVEQLEHRNGLQEPEILFMSTIYEQREGPDKFRGAMAFANWPNGKHAAFSTEHGETFEEFEARVNGEVNQ